MVENQAFVYVLNSKYSAKFAISAILINPQQDTKSDNFSHYALNLHEGVKRMAVFFAGISHQIRRHLKLHLLMSI